MKISRNGLSGPKNNSKSIPNQLSKKSKVWNLPLKVKLRKTNLLKPKRTLLNLKKKMMVKTVRMLQKLTILVCNNLWRQKIVKLAVVKVSFRLL